MPTGRPSPPFARLPAMVRPAGRRSVPRTSLTSRLATRPFPRRTPFVPPSSVRSSCRPPSCTATPRPLACPSFARPWRPRSPVASPPSAGTRRWLVLTTSTSPAVRRLRSRSPSRRFSSRARATRSSSSRRTSPSTACGSRPLVPPASRSWPTRRPSRSTPTRWLPPSPPTPRRSSSTHPTTRSAQSTRARRSRRWHGCLALPTIPSRSSPTSPTARSRMARRSPGFRPSTTARSCATRTPRA